MPRIYEGVGTSLTALSIPRGRSRRPCAGCRASRELKRGLTQATSRIFELTWLRLRRLCQSHGEIYEGRQEILFARDRGYEIPRWPTRRSSFAVDGPVKRANRPPRLRDRVRNIAALGSFARQNKKSDFLYSRELRAHN